MNWWLLVQKNIILSPALFFFNTQSKRITALSRNIFSFALDKEKAETNDDHKSFASHVIRSFLHSFRPTAIFFRPSCLTSSYGSMCSAETSRATMASPLQARHHRLGKIWHFCSPLPFHFLVSTFTLSPFPFSSSSNLSLFHAAHSLNVWPCMRQHDFSERSLVPPVGTLVLSCSGDLRLPHSPPIFL